MNEEMNVLVYGANGVQGGAIARRLHDEGFTVAGVVRDAPAADALARAGVRVVVADLEDEAALRRANDGARTVVLTLPLEWDPVRALRWARNAGSAARAAGVERVVLNSGTRLPAERSDVPAWELRRDIEDAVKEFGVPYVVLRPTLFLENLLGPAIAAGLERGVFAYPLPANFRASWLSVHDLGGYAAAALRRPDLVGQTLEVGGPEDVTGPEVATRLSIALGRAIVYEAVSPGDFERALTGQFGETVARGIAKAYHYSAAHSDTDLFTGASADLTRALSRPRLRADEWARTQTWPW